MKKKNAKKNVMCDALQTTPRSLHVSPPVAWDGEVLLTLEGFNGEVKGHLIVPSSARWQEIAVSVLLRYPDLQPVPFEWCRDAIACHLGGSVTVIVHDRNNGTDS